MKKEKIISLGFLIAVISLLLSQIAIFFSGPSRSDDYVTDVYIENDIAYLISNNGLIIMDVSNPSQPIELGRLSEGLGGYSYYDEVYVYENFAFIINDKGFKIISVFNPSNPYLVSEFNFGLDSINGMYVDFPFAYLTHSSEFSIINMVTIFNISEIGHIGLGDKLYDIQVNNSIAYIASENGLKILDVNNLTNPIELGQYNADDTYHRCILDGNIIYILGGWSKPFIDIIDVSNPSNPIKLGHYKKQLGILDGFFFHNGILYLANWNDGIELIDVSNPSKPFKFGQFYIKGANNLYIDFPLAYIACSDYGFKIVNISNPSLWRDIPVVINFIITIISIGFVVSIILLKLLVKNKEV